MIAPVVMLLLTGDRSLPNSAVVIVPTLDTVTIVL